jgi:DNA-binding transcriptional ArsR family regulator
MGDELRAIIIAWLGDLYDADGRMGANPDYRDEADVGELVAAILSWLGELD